MDVSSHQVEVGVGRHLSISDLHEDCLVDHSSSEVALDLGEFLSEESERDIVNAEEAISVVSPVDVDGSRCWLSNERTENSCLLSLNNYFFFPDNVEVSVKG